MRSSILLAASVSLLLACSSEAEPVPQASGGSAGAPSATGGAAGTGNAGAGPSAAGGSSSSGAAGGSAGATTGPAAGGSAGAAPGGAGGSGGSASSGGTPEPGSAGAAGSGGSGGNNEPLGPVTVYIAGDSTVMTYPDTPSPTDQAGWGQMLHESFSDLVKIDNRAIGGRTARRFIDEGRLADILEDIQPGDYFLVQFGTNDGHKTATYEINGQIIPYYLDPDTDFKKYLLEYIEGARAKQATPVLVTPPPRNSAYCTGGNGTGAHAEAMRQLGKDKNVTVVDLNKKTVDHLKAICPAPTPEDVFLLRGDGTVDGTHFQENGARLLAGFVAQGIAESGIGLAAYLK